MVADPAGPEHVRVYLCTPVAEVLSRSWPLIQSVPDHESLPWQTSACCAFQVMVERAPGATLAGEIKSPI